MFLSFIHASVLVSTLHMSATQSVVRDVCIVFEMTYAHQDITSNGDNNTVYLLGVFCPSESHNAQISHSTGDGPIL